MDRKNRIVLQRALVQEAIGKLRAAEEYFGVEIEKAYDNEIYVDFMKFKTVVDDLEKWVFEESSLA